MNRDTFRDVGKGCRIVLCLSAFLATLIYAGPVAAQSITVAEVYVDKGLFNGEPEPNRRLDSGYELHFERSFGTLSRYVLHTEFQKEGEFRYMAMDVARTRDIGNLELRGGLHYYQQHTPGADSGDTGTKGILGLAGTLDDWVISLDYITEDFGGADPDDPGDYVELPKLQFEVVKAASDSVHVSIAASSTTEGDIEYAVGLQFVWP